MPTGSSLAYRVRAYVVREVNFFRIHLLFFLIVPLIAAAIFYGANGRFHIPFVDSLFLCYSALTVTGLSTVNLSTLTAFQQAILFILMLIGNVTVVAWVMVLIRKRYFQQHLLARHRTNSIRSIFAVRLAQVAQRFPRAASTFPLSTDPHTNTTYPMATSNSSTSNTAAEHDTAVRNGNGDGARVDTRDRFVPSDGIGAALAGGGLGMGIGLGLAQYSPRAENEDSNNVQGFFPMEKGAEADVEGGEQFLSGADVPRSDSPEDMNGDTLRERERPRVRLVVDVPSFVSSPREIVSSPHELVSSPRSLTASQRARAVSPNRPGLRYRPGIPIPRRRTVLAPRLTPHTPHYADAAAQTPGYTYTNAGVLGLRPKDQGLGGFPGPAQLLARAVRWLFPRAWAWAVAQASGSPVHNPWGGDDGGEKEKDEGRKQEKKPSALAVWVSENVADLVIERNSDFRTEELSDEQLEQLGGLEYRALRVLSYLVIIYFIGVQLIAFILIAPWLNSTHTYDDVFAAQPRLVNKSWFVAFQVVGAYTGGGMSLVDVGMVPFQRAYLMIFAMIWAILAGNHGLPILWIMTKFVEDNSTWDLTLHFLLDHPRRCFLYLFPSHVTWFLFASLVCFTAVEWTSFIVLDHGLAVIDALPSWPRAVAGLFQSFAVRASGFSIVSLASLAPSFQFLCIVMMYIAVYPVALSIRSTNVYEEKSLGVFEAGPEDEDEEPELSTAPTRRERIGRYLGWHLRRQVAFDIWWLVCGIFVICIIERTKIMDDDNAPWFNVFRIIFELVSAFGGIGLTLGIPTENFAFSGAFGPLSKLVVIVIMLRGRHRGLPVAIDRAILLPEDIVRPKDTPPEGVTDEEKGGAGPMSDVKG